MLSITNGSLSKSAEKLSSGYKVNRAADDAAGLSISEKMRKQIRGLDQASANAQDGISAVQTAEGALTEVHDMLQRMNELAVKASNGTMSEDDRQTLQDEVDQLLTEVDRVAETTKFNETYLLKGNDNKTVTITCSAYDAGLKGYFSKTATGARSTTVASGQSVSEVYFSVTFTAGEKVTIAGKDYVIDTTVDTGDYKKSNTSSINAADAVDMMTKELKRANGIGNTNAKVENQSSDPTKTTTGKFTFKITKGTTQTNGALDFSLHVGADADMTNKIAVSIDSMDTKGLGINKLNVRDTDGMGGTYAIDAISEAVSRVSKTRSALGAIQNRLEHTIKNLDNIVENTTAAESQIRDTDMADEMVKYSNNNILAQAGQSMVAQANQSNQGVLSLL
jgi:flagellin